MLTAPIPPNYGPSAGQGPLDFYRSSSGSSGLGGLEDMLMRDYNYNTLQGYKADAAAHNQAADDYRMMHSAGSYMQGMPSGGGSLQDYGNQAFNTANIMRASVGPGGSIKAAGGAELHYGGNPGGSGIASGGAGGSGGGGGGVSSLLAIAQMRMQEEQARRNEALQLEMQRRGFQNQDYQGAADLYRNYGIRMGDQY